MQCPYFKNEYYSYSSSFSNFCFEGFPVYEIKQGKVTDIVKVVPVVFCKA